MKKRNNKFIIGLIVSALTFAIVVFTPAILSAFVFVSIGTQGGIAYYKVNNKDYGSDRQRTLKVLSRYANISTGPFQIMVDSNTTIVTVAKLIEELKHSNPESHWYITYVDDKKEIKVLHEATVYVPEEILIISSDEYNNEPKDHN